MESEKQFRFKQFALSQTGCAMRIGTDGLLLGAWAKAPFPKEESGKESALRILDLGCGTGLIALMLAQRYPHAQVTAIDIEPDAAATAKRNAENSPFHDRVNVLCADFFTRKEQALLHPWDLIASNPPYFSDGPAASTPARNRARHTLAGFSLPALFAAAAELLSARGHLALITPPDTVNRQREYAVAHGLYPYMLQPVVTVRGKAPKRLLSCWTRNAAEACLEDLPDFIVREASGAYTPAYRDLTAAFHPRIV